MCFDTDFKHKTNFHCFYRTFHVSSQELYVPQMKVAGELSVHAKLPVAQSALNSFHYDISCIVR